MKLNFKSEKNFKVDENEFICEYIEKYVENINTCLIVFDKKNGKLI